MPIRYNLKLTAATTIILFASLTPSLSQSTEGFGKPGEPVKLTVGYLPNAAPLWAAVVNKAKGFWKKHLPQGSEVTFEPAAVGTVSIGELLAGKQQITYVADMPAVAVAAKPELADVRIVAATSVSHDQCSVFLVRHDAPEFASPEEAVKWMNGKTAAAPHGTCADHFARKVFQDLDVKPAKYFNQAGDQIAANLKDGKVDGAFIFEPVASLLVEKGLARRAATGANFKDDVSSFVVMRQDLIAARPDVAKAWLEGELDTQLFLADPKNANEIVSIIKGEVKELPPKVIWNALYGQGSAAAGSDGKVVYDFAITPRVSELIKSANAFLFGLKRVPSAELRADGVAGQIADSVLKARGLHSPVGIIKPLPQSAAAN